MKKLKTALSKLALLALLSFFAASCMTTKTPVGNYQAIQGEEYTYAKGKQVWLFWGLLPAGRTNVNTPSDGDCEVVTRFNFGDFLITTITAGIVTTYSIKVRAKRKG